MKTLNLIKDKWINRKTSPLTVTLHHFFNPRNYRGQSTTRAFELQRSLWGQRRRNQLHVLQDGSSFQILWYLQTAQIDERKAGQVRSPAEFPFLIWGWGISFRLAGDWWSWLASRHLNAHKGQCRDSESIESRGVLPEGNRNPHSFEIKVNQTFDVEAASSAFTQTLAA
jgi:hypothetical protein